MYKKKMATTEVYCQSSSNENMLRKRILEVQQNDELCSKEKARRIQVPTKLMKNK